ANSATLKARTLALSFAGRGCADGAMRLDTTKTQSGHCLFSRNWQIFARGRSTSNYFDVTAQIVNLIREGERKMDATHGFINSLQLDLHLREMLAAGIGIDGCLQRLQPTVPIKQTSSHSPAVQHRQVMEHGNHNCDNGCDHRD